MSKIESYPAVSDPLQTEKTLQPLKTVPHPSRLTSKQVLQLLSTFVVFFNTWGLLVTTGAFQTYYEQVLLRDRSPSSISWISTIYGFILFSAGLFTGPLYDYGFYRPLMLTGSLLQVFGLMMVSLSTEYYQLFLSQGICAGIGAGIVFTPSVAAAAACFTSPAARAKAMGLLAFGSSIGGIIYPLVFRTVLPQVGFPWTVRIIAFIALSLYLISYLRLIITGPKKQQSTAVRRMFDTSAFTDPPFISLCLFGLTGGMAYMLTLLYLPTLAQLKIPDLNTDLKFDLLAILNGASGAGRLVAGLVAAKLGSTETVLASSIICSLILFCWLAVTSVAGVIVFAVFWGMVSGVFIALIGAVIPLFCPLALIGTRMGMFWVWGGMGVLIGPPIAGALVDVREEGMNSAWRLVVFAGCMMVVGSVALVYPVVKLRRRARTEEDRGGRVVTKT